MKKIIISILIVAIIFFLAFWFSPAMRLKRENPTLDFASQQAINTETTDQYSDWKSTVWNGVSFQYPSNWKIENKSMESTGKLMEDRIFIQGPSSENQAIVVIKNPAPESFKNFMTLRTVKSVTFAIPTMLSEESQKIFLQIVASAK